MKETIHQDPEFQRKKTAYFQNFIVRHRPQARKYKENGLLNEEGARGWRNVAKHQLLTAVITETVTELIGMSKEESERLTNLMLTHDVHKRREQEELTKEQEIEFELSRTQRPLIATGSNFTGFNTWGIEEFILRYADSSVGENSTHWYGARSPNNLPPVVILPWRERLEMFKQNKVEEGERGRELYGITTWEMLDKIMKTIEPDLFQKMIERNPELAERYTDHTQLTQLIEDRIHEKILSS